MSEPAFRLVAAPTALIGAPAGWAAEMLRDGEVALLAAEGLEAVNRVAHELERPSVPIIRAEDSSEAQDGTVIDYAGHLPLIWIAPGFSDHASDWATQRGPMTLLVVSDRPLGDEERRRIDRFVAILGRQSE